MHPFDCLVSPPCRTLLVQRTRPKIVYIKKSSVFLQKEESRSCPLERGLIGSNPNKGFFFFLFFPVCRSAIKEREKKKEIEPPLIHILRPLSPHLPIYKPQLTSTFSIFHRISGAFLATIVLFFYLLCLKMGLICFTYANFYGFFFYSSKLILISVEITALALSYHLYNGVRHLLTDFSFLELIEMTLQNFPYTFELRFKKFYFFL